MPKLIAKKLGTTVDMHVRELLNLARNTLSKMQLHHAKKIMTKTGFEVVGLVKVKLLYWVSKTSNF